MGGHVATDTQRYVLAPGPGRAGRVYLFPVESPGGLFPNRERQKNTNGYGGPEAGSSLEWVVDAVQWRSCLVYGRGRARAGGVVAQCGMDRRPGKVRPGSPPYLHASSVHYFVPRTCLRLDTLKL